MSESDNSPPETVAEIKSDIERTRAELAETVDALTAKLDVKEQAKQRVHEIAERAGSKYEQAKASAPEPVQQAIGTVEQAARPVVDKAAQDKRKTAMIAGGVVVLVLIVRRIRRSHRD
jgi:hypothetical protein